MFSIEALFCHIDDFCASFEPQWHKQLITHGIQTRQRSKSLCLSEIMTILIIFHQNHYRNFKNYYLAQVCQHFRFEFPNLPSYHRFIEWMPSTLLPLCVYLKHCFGRCTGISFLDATSIKVCHNRRISRHKVFEGLADRGKTSVDWFYGFKLHLVVNERGELLKVNLTSGNVDDRSPVSKLLNHLFRKVFADRGYVSQKLVSELFNNYKIEFFAKPRRNMTNRLMRLYDKLLSRHSSIIETIIDQLKNISRA